MYDEAAEVAKSMLSVLVRNGTNDGDSGQAGELNESDDDEEVESMIEAAGMVLLQALNQKEKYVSFFKLGYLAFW
jgi:hypothetical protein